MQHSRKHRFLDMFPLPKYLSSGHVSCATDGDIFRLIKFSHKRFTRIKYSGLFQLPSMLEKLPKVPSADMEKAIFIALSQAKAKTISLVIPEQSVYVFLTDVPIASPKLIREAISFQLEGHVPIASSDALFEYDIVVENTAKQTVTVTVRVVSEEYIESLIAFFPKNILVVGCDTEGKALARAIVPFDDKAYLVIHIGAATTTFVVARNGAPLFSSTIAKEFSRISQEMVKIFSASLCEEANTVINYWNFHAGESMEMPITAIFLSGEDAIFPGIVSYLELSFSIPVFFADVWRNAKIKPGKVPPIEFDKALGFVPAIGMAIELQ